MRKRSQDNTRDPTSLSAQAQFFRAAEEGSVSGMQRACQKGADPTMPFAHDLGGAVAYSGMMAWHIVVTRAPVSTMKTCFAFLKEHRVPLFNASRCKDEPLQHPFLYLMGRTNLTPQALGAALWHLWCTMEPTEQQRLVYAEDVWTYTAENDAFDDVQYRASLASMRAMPFEKTHVFLSKTYRSSLSALAPLFSKDAPADSRLTHEAVVFLVRTLSLGRGVGSDPSEEEDANWGILCAMAPIFILKACLHTPSLVTLLLKNLTSSLKAFQREGFQAPRTQETCLLLLRRLHNAGLRWPDQWPEETREVLCAFPDVRVWIERRALEQALSSVPSSGARRARV